MCGGVGGLTVGKAGWMESEKTVGSGKAAQMRSTPKSPGPTYTPTITLLLLHQGQRP